MSIRDKLFGSKADRAEKKAENAVKKADRKVEESERINAATNKSEAAKFAEKAQAELDYERKVRRARSALIVLEKKERVELERAIRELQHEEEKGEYANREDLAGLKRNVKNIFYRLTTFERSKKMLEQAEKNHRWKESMNELSNVYKLMNIVNGSGDGFVTDKVKLILFRYRRWKAEGIKNDSDKQLQRYFGKNAETEISDEIYELVGNAGKDKELIDVMVSDKLITDMMAAARNNDADALRRLLSNCTRNSDYIPETPDEIVHEAEKANEAMRREAGQPYIDAIKSDREFTTEDEEELREEIPF